MKRALWVKARPDYEPLFSILDGMRHDAGRRFWIKSFVTPEDNCVVEEDTGQVSTGVEIVLQMSHNTLSDRSKIGKRYVGKQQRRQNRRVTFRLCHQIS